MVDLPEVTFKLSRRGTTPYWLTHCVVLDRSIDRSMNEWKNVDKKPSFPPSPSSTQTKQPYSFEEKNFHVKASNDLWGRTFWPFYPSLNEIYYRLLLHRIKQFEYDEKFLFNKGIVYGNLGVAQAAQKIDRFTYTFITS